MFLSHNFLLAVAHSMLHPMKRFSTLLVDRRALPFLAFILYTRLSLSLSLFFLRFSFPLSLSSVENFVWFFFNFLPRSVQSSRRPNHDQFTSTFLNLVDWTTIEGDHSISWSKTIPAVHFSLSLPRFLLLLIDWKWRCLHLNRPARRDEKKKKEKENKAVRIWMCMLF